MIKIISIVIMMLAFNSIFAQRIGYFGGLNRNHFYDFKNDDKLAYYEANYTTGTGFEFGVSIENVKIDSYNENKITLVAQSENFYFKITGFGEDQSEDVRWKYRSYSI